MLIDHRTRTAGFTLIEAMISIGLGMIIVYTAFAGFRVASQSVTVANKLALENSLIRAGFMAALDEADFWRMYDDPDDSGNQKLRSAPHNGPGGTPRSLAFASFPQYWPKASSGGVPEADRGWDPDYQWPARDPRTWFHGNLVEGTNDTRQRFGHYELFTHVKDKPDLSKKTYFMYHDPLANKDIPTPTYGTTAPIHTWYPNQLEGLKNTLSYYGALEYMPTGATYGVHGDVGDDQRLSQEWCAPSGAESSYRVANGDGGCQWPRGIYLMTKDTSFALIPDTPFTEPFNPNPDLWVQNYTNYNTTQYSSTTAITHFTNRAVISKPLMADPTNPLVSIKPQNWPELSIAVSRYICYMRITNLCKVRWTSPLTGELVELTFNTLSTSLRGARQQRKDGGGWAKVGDTNLDGGQVKIYPWSEATN